MTYIKKYIVPALLTFFAAIVLWQIQRDRLKMTYTIINSESFPLDSITAKFFVITLVNSGNKEIENVDVNILFEGTSIENFITSNLGTEDFKIVQNRLIGRIPLFNPNEQLIIKCTVKGDSAELKSFEARAKGVTAQPQSNYDFSPLFYLIALLAVMITIFLVFVTFRQFKLDNAINVIDVDKIAEQTNQISNKLNEKLKLTDQEHEERMKELEKQSETLKKDRERLLEEHKKEIAKAKAEQLEIQKGKPDRPQIILKHLNEHKLTSVFFKILQLGEGTTYLNTGFVLFEEFLRNGSDKENCLQALKKISEVEGMAPTSKGTIYYLIGKMESKNGNLEKVMYWFNKCRDEYPLLYDYLIDGDEKFNINQLYDWINMEQP